MWLSEGVNVLGRFSVEVTVCTGDCMHAYLVPSGGRQVDSEAGWEGRKASTGSTCWLTVNGRMWARRGSSSRDRQFLPGVTWVAVCEDSTLFYW